MKIEPMVFIGCWAEFKVRAGVAAEGVAKVRGYVSGVTLGGPCGRVATRLLISEDGRSEPYGWDYELFQDDITAAALLTSKPV